MYGVLVLQTLMALMELIQSLNKWSTLIKTALPRSDRVRNEIRRRLGEQEAILFAM